VGCVNRVLGFIQIFAPNARIASIVAAGARVIEVPVRDVPEDSASAEYGWIVYDFDGRVLDFLTT
jgi:hypothetical protein